jgi:acetyl esterase/lipase
VGFDGLGRRRATISRRRLLAGAVTGATLLVIPRDVLGPTGQASATTEVRTSGLGSAVSTRAPKTPLSARLSVAPQSRRTAGPAAITLGPQYRVVVESIYYRAQMGTVYRPQVIAAHPVVYFLHGGLWEYGSRHQYDGEARIWAERGWVAVTLDYSLSTGYRTMLRDIWAGIAYVEEQWYADTQRQILFGDSAGGHLAALIATQHPEHFAAQILWSPVISPYNAYRDGLGLLSARARLGQAAERIVGNDWLDADPSRQVTRDTPPLWVAGSAKEFVSFKHQGQLLADALGQDRAEVHIVSGDRHGKNLEQGPLLRGARTWARDQIR